MTKKLLLSLVLVTLAGLPAYAEDSRSIAAGPVSFAKGGQLNMVYDIRQRPQAVYLDGKVYIVFAGRTNEVPVGEKPSTHPMLITYDPASREFSDVIMLGPGDGDHHSTPIVWADRDEHLHVLYGCHRTAGVHLVSKAPREVGDSLEAWEIGDQIEGSMSYPTVFRIYDNMELIYYRTIGHNSSWTFRISDSKGKSWAGPENDVTDMDLDFERWPEWSSYQSKLASADGKSLYVCFMSYDDVKSNDPKRLYNPRYKKPVRNDWKYDLYLIKVDLKTYGVTNFQGQALQTPIDIEQANEKCRIWDTDWRGAGVPPAMKLGKNGNPAMLHVLSGDTLEQHNYYYVRYVGGKWKQTLITGSNHQWNSCHLADGAGGALHAYIITGRGYLNEEGFMDAHGGGRIEEWTSGDDGNSWKKLRDITPDKTKYAGWKFNNIQPVKKPDGTIVE
ncbi:MAG: BNR-4 repeat-containing protein, partial [Planctomycetes bacterium]|nr:BNR-4 repeat-containing protein [Planctomycetota bacterium]